jgi:hypothetical protein
MMAITLRIGFSILLGLALAGRAALPAQEPAKSKDDGLDSLLKKLAGPSDRPAPQSGKAAGAGASGSGAGKVRKASGDKTKKTSASKASTVAPKDQAVDDLLEKLGETKDAPAREDAPRNPAGLEPNEPSRAEKPKAAAKLGGKDKEIDERLEEYAGRKKKRRPTDEQPGGPIGEIIKEMKDVEKRLAKPDSGDDTQSKQKQIVRHIDALIEQVRQSGSAGGRLVLRRIRQRGQQPGQQPGDQTGALARGAPPMKPAKPTSQHSTASGKDIWGHLPPELREVMENSFKEAELSSKAEMISRYFLSINKGKRVREE